MTDRRNARWNASCGEMRASWHTPVRSGPWGLKMTFAFTLLAIAAVFFVQIAASLVAQVIMAITHGTGQVAREAHSLHSNGLFMSLVVCFSAPAAISVILLAVWLRQYIFRGPSFVAYIGLRPASITAYILGFMALFAYIYCSGVLARYFHQDMNNEKSMIQAYTTAGYLPLLWFAFLVVGPFWEEILFRGFLFEGVRHSSWGPAGAILCSALGWALLHFQYDLFGMAMIALLGVVLGIVRWKSNSLRPALVLHLFNNFLATLQTAYFVSQQSS